MSFTSVKAECLVLDCTCRLKAHVNLTTHLRLSLGLTLGLAHSSHHIVWPSSTVVAKTHCIAPFSLVVSMALWLAKKIFPKCFAFVQHLVASCLQNSASAVGQISIFFLKCMIKKNGCVLYGTVHSICCCRFITMLKKQNRGITSIPQTH